MLPDSFRDPGSSSFPSPRTTVVIPARYHSTRLPGKPLALINGLPMIVHVYRQACAARGVDSVVVATDDDRVVRAVEASGGVAVLTAASHATGLDRVAEVAATLPSEIVVNVQGDEPMLHPETIQATIAPLLSDPTLDMATACRALSSEADYLNPHVVKLVRRRDGSALYFSRSPIPHVRGPRPAIWKHLGLYAYRRTFVLQLAALEPTPLERAESLEQLRALEHGFRVYAAVTEHDSIGVDTPEDLDRVRHLLGPAPRADGSTLSADNGAHEVA